MREYRRKEFRWDKDGELIFQGRAVASLIPHEIHPDMYHLKFDFTEEKTPKFWNKTWARENAFQIYLRYLSGDISAASTELTDAFKFKT